MNTQPDSESKSVEMISVLLADDHTVVREGLKIMLEIEGDIKVVGQAENGRVAVEMAEQLRPAVIVMDIGMPLLNGLEATRQILKALPQTRIVLLSAYCDDGYIEQAMALGAAGYLIKQTSLSVLAQVIRDVNKGRIFYDPSIMSHLEKPGQIAPRDRNTVRKLQALSSREVEVLQLIAEGCANKRIASELGISVKTVDKHRQNLMEKLNIHDTAGLTRYAISSGVIEKVSRIPG